MPRSRPQSRVGACRRRQARSRSRLFGAFTEAEFITALDADGQVQGEPVLVGDLQAEAQRGIALLTERRCALIAAAVTGQIDVRGFTAA